MNRFLLLTGALVTFCPALWASHPRIDCSVGVDVNAKLTRVETEELLGAERLECQPDSQGAVGQVRLMRTFKTGVQAGVEVSARADARASASFSDSCSGSCHAHGSGSCHHCGHSYSWGDHCHCSCYASGSGSDTCSDSDSAQNSRSEEKKTTFVVAKIQGESLAAKGFRARHGTGAQACEILDPQGSVLDPLRAIAVISWIYGEELMKETEPSASAGGGEGPGAGQK